MIEDEEFLREVHESQRRFGSGDRLFVELRSVQKDHNGKFKVEHYIEKVKDHKEATGQQQSLGE